MTKNKNNGDDYSGPPTEREIRFIEGLKSIYDDADFMLRGDFRTDDDQTCQMRLSIIDQTLDSIQSLCKEMIPEDSLEKEAIEVNCTITYWKKHYTTKETAAMELSETLTCPESPHLCPENLKVHSVKEVKLKPIDKDGSYFEL